MSETKRAASRRWKWDFGAVATTFFVAALMVAMFAGGVVTVLQRVDPRTLLDVFTSITWWAAGVMCVAFAVKATLVWWDVRNHPN